MKRIIIITGILLLSFTAFAQRGSRERAGRNDRDHKSAITSGRDNQSRRTRTTNRVSSHYLPVKAHKIHYRSPEHVRVIWTRRMYHEYRVLYPEFRYWNYPVGVTILTIPAYRAGFHIGEVRNVYGRVHEVWYSWSTDEYYLYFGGPYPYQDFSVILPGRDARRFNRFPERFFEGRYLWVTGLVSTFDGKPELLVRRNSQVHLY